MDFKPYQKSFYADYEGSAIIPSSSAEDFVDSLGGSLFGEKKSSKNNIMPTGQRESSKNRKTSLSNKKSVMPPKRKAKPFIKRNGGVEMAKKKSFKQYSAEDKVKFHAKRMKNSSLSKAKRNYSEFWLYGFTDPHALVNLDPSFKEMRRLQRNGEFKGDPLNAAFYRGLAYGRKTVCKTGMLPAHAAKLAKKHGYKR